jgi:hypothetical protein
MTFREGVWNLCRRVWNLVEPMIEHGLISVLLACITFLVSRLLVALASDERAADMRGAESYFYGLVVVLYAIHAGGVLLVRIARVIAEEVQRPQGAAVAALPLAPGPPADVERVAGPDLPDPARPGHMRRRRER